MTSKTDSIILQKGLSLYKQPIGNGKGSPNWYARVYLPLAGRNQHVKTTRTTDVKGATKFARDFYGECLAKKAMLDGGYVSPSSLGATPAVRFDKVADEFVDAAFSAAGNDRRAIRKAQDYKGAINSRNGLAAFFGKRDVNTISTKLIREFLSFQVEKSKTGRLAPASQKRTLSVLSQVLKFAQENYALGPLPALPRIKMVDNPRPWFEKAEYQTLYKTAFGLAQAGRKAGDVQEALLWQELGDYIVFMVATFLRPSEWAELQHKHLKVIDGAQRYVQLNVTRGKTGDRNAVSMETAIAVYARVCSRYGSEPSTFLFFPQSASRVVAMKRMRKLFGLLLDRTGLRLDSAGRRRTLYSLRHTALMLRITEGNVNVLHLAQNAGTSIEMLQRFYLKRLEPSQSVVNLQSFR